jgi:hypothetical protein
MRITAILFLGLGLALAACGQDGQQADPGAVDAGPDATSATAGGAGESELSATARSCLDLVADGQLVQAVDPCSQAAREYPDNQEVSEALRQARAAADQAGRAAQDAAGQAEAWKKTGEALAQ